MIKFIEPDNFEENPRWLFLKAQCHHCGEAACLQVCPTGAIKRRPNGVVYIDQDVCTGCKYCVEVCPFGVPHPDPNSGTARKCWMCLNRVENGLEPACAKACPTGAVSFGTRTDMLALAKARSKALDAQGYAPRIYGEDELGGLGAMHLLTEKASVFGLPEDPRLPHAKIAIKWLLGVVPGLAILGLVWRYLHKQGRQAEAETIAETKAKTNADTKAGGE